jgi:hypothetical protein
MKKPPTVAASNPVRMPHLGRHATNRVSGLRAWLISYTEGGNNDGGDEQSLHRTFTKPPPYSHGKHPVPSDEPARQPLIPAAVSNDPSVVMAGHSRPRDGVASARLCPAIHAFGHRENQDVDARDKRGHDESRAEAIGMIGSQ